MYYLPYILRLTISIGVFFVLWPFSQDARANVDCTPICGNPTCCIVSEVAVPTCVVEGDDAKQVRSIQDPQAAAKTASECVANPSRTRKPLLDQKSMEGVERLSCHWGCCKSNTIMRFAESNSESLMSKVEDEEILSALKNFGADATRVSELESKLDAAADRLCIFCCYF